MSEEQQSDQSQTNTEERSAETILYDSEKKESTEETKEAQSETPVEETKESTDESQEAEKSEEFDLKLPENTLLSDDAKAEMLELAKEHGLKAESAQKFLDIQSELLTEFQEQSLAEHNQQVTAWGEEIKADKELGGENLEANVRLVKKAVTEFAGEEFLTELDQTGYANHPQLFRMLVNIGKELEAKGLVLGDTNSEAPKSMAEAFYGSSKT